MNNILKGLFIIAALAFFFSTKALAAGLTGETPFFDNELASYSKNIIKKKIRFFYSGPIQMPRIPYKREDDRPLRLLANLTTCGSSTNHDGYEPSSGKNTLLETEACALVNAIPPEAQPDFAVYDYSMYPLLMFSDHEEAHEKAFNAMLQEVQNTSTYYLLMGKQIDPEENRVILRVALKLPQVGNLEQINPTIERYYEQLLLNKLQQETDNSLHAEDFATAEIATMILLKQLLQNPGDFNKITPEILKANGFEEIALSSDQGSEIFERSGTETDGDNYYDFTGLTSGGQPVITEMGDGLNAFTQASGFAASGVLTDNLNY